MLPSDIAVEQRRFYAIKLFERDDKNFRLMRKLLMLKQLLIKVKKN